MAKLNLLTDRRISGTKCPSDKAFIYLNDGSGLRLKVYNDGRKQWHFRLVYDGRESTQSFGAYPLISLAAAREKANASRGHLSNGFNPVQEKKKQKRLIANSYNDPFKDVAEEALKYFKIRPGKPWSDKHYKRSKGILINYVYKKLGAIPINQIDHVIVLDLLKEIHGKGIYTTAHHAKNVISSIFTFAIHSNKAKDNPTLVLQKNTLLSRPKVQHLKSLEIEEVGKFVSTVQGNASLHVVTKSILMLHLYTALRVNSLRQAKWGWLNINDEILTVPAEFMKNRQAFKVPLPKVAIEIFKKLKPITYRGGDSYIFQTGQKLIPISENTSTNAIKKLGFAATSHGMRTLMKRVLTKQNKYPYDAIERQLDHKRPPLDDAYMGDEDWLKERKVMLQWYAKWIDSQRVKYEMEKNK